MSPAARAFAALATLAWVCAPAAQAQSEPSAGAEADITGTWNLQTKSFWDLCRITGHMTLTRSGPDAYVGDLFAHQRCGNGHVGYVEWRAEQTVEAVRDGDRLSIRSTIVRVTPPSTTYAPDDFELAIIDGSLMMGELSSYLPGDPVPLGVVEAAFQRGDQPVA